MPKTHAYVAEIVTFRLQEGSSPEAFVTAAAAMDRKLRAGGDVISRVLSADADGLWTDHIVWTSMEAAKATAEAIMQDPDALPMMQMIDPQGVQMRHAPIHHQLE